MRSRLKKFLSIVLITVMMISVVPILEVKVKAAYENTYKNTGNYRKDIIGVAKTQIGYTEGSGDNNKYGKYFGKNNLQWCAYFVSWCARQAGIPESILKTSAGAGHGKNYFNIPYEDGGKGYIPKSGDLFFTKEWSHVGLVSSVSGNYFYSIEGNTNNPNGGNQGVFSRRRKISEYYFGVPKYGDDPHTHSYTKTEYEAAHPHKEYKKCSCGATKYTGKTRVVASCSQCAEKDKRYSTPMKAYTINTGKTTVYNAISGNAKANKIYDTDLCTINTIYKNGWCKVTFPLDKTGGTDSGYVKTSVFFDQSYDVFGMKAGKQIKSYARSNLKSNSKTDGYVGSGDKFLIIGHTSKAVQVEYPLTGGGYKAAWIPISALKDTIKYNANGGSGSMSNGSVQYNGSITLAANKYTKKGYTFGGWNLYRSSDKTWYAGSKGWNTDSVINSKKYSKSVYKNSFSGKFNKSWLEGGKTNDTYTFYAVWNPNKLNITFNANGGSLVSDTYKLNNNVVYQKSDNNKKVQTWTYNSAKTDGLCNASTFGLARTGYKFAGWGTKATGGTIFDQNDSKLTPTKINSAIEKGNCAMTLYAIWTPITYSVKYDTNGGSKAPAAQTKTYGKSLTLSSDKPMREGYEFLGWSTDKASKSAAYQPGAAYTAEKEVTLYAVWKEVYVPPVHVHKWDTQYTVDNEATCTKEGLKSIHCRTCGETKEAEKIPATGHSYAEVIAKEATCTESGIKVKRCTLCNDETDKTEIPVKEHSFVSTVTKEADCSEEGIREDICSECNLHANKEMIPKVEHVFDEWKTVKEATAKENGTESRKCLNCEYEETREVEYIPVYDENSPRISMEAVHARAGEEVTVSVKLENNPGITSMRFTLDYDTEVLTMTDFEFGEALSSMNRASSDKYDSPYSFSMYSAEKDFNDNGIIATIRFKVNENAEDGEYMIGINYDPDDVFNIAGDGIEVDIEEGFICVDADETGDVNSDGSINMRDIVLLQQVINGWDVKYNKQAADFNKDTKLNMRDIVALQQYINR